MKYCILFLLFLSACESRNSAAIPDVSVTNTDPDLQFRNGAFYYKNQPYSGSITEYYQNSKVHHRTEYLNGVQEGWQKVYFPNGSLSEKRYYKNGEKEGIHTGFWENGNKRFQYGFSKGQYDGNFKQWYRNGKPSMMILYTDGTEEEGKGWRENGKLYMSYVMKEGRRYGMINPNLCYTLKNEKGEFIKSSVRRVKL